MKSPLELASRQFQRILLIKPSSLGDIIHAMPVLAGLRHRYPDAHIAWLAGSPYAEWLTAQPALTEVIPFDRRRYGRLGRSLAASIGFVRFLGDLRRRRFDLVVDLQGLFRSGFLAWASRAPVRLGFANARELGAVFYTHRVAVPADVNHAADQNYLVADALGFADVEQDFSLHVSEAVRQRVATTLTQSGVKDLAYAVLVPGTRWQTKMWPADRFAGLADLIHDRLGLAVVLIGAPAEVELCRQVQQRARSRLVNLAGGTGLPEMVGLIQKAKAMVCNDSGPMHVAAAVRCPLVALFGPTDPARTGPHTPTARIVRRSLPCSPCFLRRLRDCPYQHRCLRSIQPEDVCDEVAALLADRPSDRPVHAVG